MMPSRVHGEHCKAIKYIEQARGILNTHQAYRLTNPQVTMFIEFLIQWLDAPTPELLDQLGNRWVVHSTETPGSAHRRLVFSHPYPITHRSVGKMLFGSNFYELNDKPMVIDCCPDL